MRIDRLLLLLTVFALTACTGADTITKKRWENRDTTVRIMDLSGGRGEFGDAGHKFGLAIEDALDDTAFVVTQKQSHYVLKFKIVEFQEGKRWKRMMTLGIDESSRAMMKARVALYNERGMLAAWEIDSWVNGGPTGGSLDSLFEKAAAEVLAHLKGY